MIQSRTICLMSLIIGLFAGAAHAQSALPTRIMRVAGKSPAFAMMQARAAARAEKLRLAWKAAGHAEPDRIVNPEILAGRIDTPSINVDRPPGTPTASVKYKTGKAGLSFIELAFYSNTSAQVYYNSFENYYEYYAAPSTHGTVTFSEYYDPFSLYAASGTWTLAYAYIYDNEGNYTFYDQTQLAALFPSLTLSVTSRYADTTNPTVSSGQVLTPTVSESATYPDFAVSMSAADTGSGVASAFVLVLPPGETAYYYETYGQTPTPAASTTLTSYLYVQGLPTGTWTIGGYGACDAASNCFFDYSTADVQTLFGTTTFTVTD